MHVKVSMANLEVISEIDFPISQIQRAYLNSHAHTQQVFSLVQCTAFHIFQQQW
jgi:hypothetical protein